MKSLTLFFSAAVAALPCLVSAKPDALVAFGPGKAGLTATGAGSFKITSPAQRASVRFTPADSGLLTEFKFAANPGRGFVSHQDDAFSVGLHADAAGSPGREIARASETIFNDAGARVRVARFTPGTEVKAGTVYHLVIASAQANPAEKVFGIEYALLGQNIVPLHSLEMERPDPAAALLTSSDGGGTWEPIGRAIATHEVVIGGKRQGWAYTGTVEMSLKRGPAGNQYVMQSFRFDTNGRGGKAVPQNLLISLRPQGTLVNRPVKLFAEIVTPVGFHTIAEALAEVTLPDASRFDAVTLPFGKATLTNDTDYVLIVGLINEDTAAARDFLFMRGYSWGIGSPNLHDLSWQGTAGGAYLSTESSNLGKAIPGADVPFVIEYLPAK